MNEIQNSKKLFTRIIINCILLLIMLVLVIICPILLQVIHVLVIFGVFAIGVALTIYASYSLYTSKSIKKIIITIFEYFQIALGALLIVQIVFGFIVFPATVNQSSMYPTLQEGERILVQPSKKIERFNIVVFEFDDQYQKKDMNIEDGTLLIKRVIGLPGENIKIENGKLYVNNQEVEDENSSKSKNLYLEQVLTDELKAKALQPDGSYIIPDGWYLLLGDNRPGSLDSEEFGLVKKSQIYGKAKFRMLNLFSWDKI